MVSHRSRSAVLALGLLSLAVASGCSTPSVQVKSAVLQSATPQGPRFDALLAIENPNSFDIQVRAVRANVRVAGATIPVVVQPNVWVPADGTASVAVPVTIPWSAVPPLGVGAVTQSQIPYTITGNADVTASRSLDIDYDAYRFAHQGTLPRSVFVTTGTKLPLSIGIGTWR